MPAFDNLTIKILPVFSANVATLLKSKSVGFANYSFKSVGKSVG